jgi:hypothetical protein
MLAIKLKKVNDSTRFAHFPTLPSFLELATAIFEIFQIPPEDVGLAFVDKDNNLVILTNDPDLQEFYNLQHSEEIKFVVQNLQNPDCALDSSRLLALHFSLISTCHDHFNLVITSQSVRFIQHR